MANILVFGASIAQGYYDTEGGWADRLKRYFIQEELKHNWEQSINVFNLALSGDTSKDVLSRISKETKQRIWSNHKLIFIFEIGTNDSIIINGKPKVPLSEFRKNLNQLLKFCKTYSDKIIFLGLTPVDEPRVTPMTWSPSESYLSERIKKYNDEVKVFSNRNNLGFVDLHREFTKVDFKKNLHDGVHPNSQGHKKIFEIVRDFLVKEKLI